jgi:hypothetical protein
MLGMRKMLLAPLIIVYCLPLLGVAQVKEDPGEPGIIAGTVVTSDGSPLENAKVYLRERNMPQMGAIRYVRTNQDGEFRITNLRPGDYDVFAVPSDFSSMLTRWTQRVHLPKDKPFRKIVIRVGPANATG